MARQTINRGSSANDGTGDTLRQAGQKINQNFGEIYNLLGGDSDNLASNLSFTDSAVVFTDSSYNVTLKAVNITADRTITLPNITDTLVTKTTTDTLTNKTLTSPVLTTPQINDTSADHQYVVAVNELAADRTITLPLLTGNDTFVFNSHAATLTNKTLTTPTLVRPIVQGFIDDSAGAVVLDVQSTASAVNYLQVANSATGNRVTLTASGTDSDVGLTLTPTQGGVINIKKPALEATTFTNAGTVNRNTGAGTIIGNRSAGGYTIVLRQGSVAGEVKQFVNINSSTMTVTPVNSALANIFKNPSNGSATGFSLDQWGATTAAWTGSYWVLTGNIDSDQGVHIV